MDEQGGRVDKIRLDLHVSGTTADGSRPNIINSTGPSTNLPSENLQIRITSLCILPKALLILYRYTAVFLIYYIVANHFSRVSSGWRAKPQVRTMIFYGAAAL